MRYYNVIQKEKYIPVGSRLRIGGMASNHIFFRVGTN